MTGYSKPDSLEKLSIAPLSLRSHLEELIDNEINLINCVEQNKYNNFNKKITTIFN